MKKNKFLHPISVASLVCALAASFVGASAFAQAATETGENPIIINRNSSSFDNPVSRIYTGRSPYMNSAPSAPAPARPAEPRPAPAPKVEYSGAETCWGLVKLQKMAPATASVGENITYTLTAVGQCDVTDVVITDTISPNATYVSSDPAATVDGKKLTWKLSGMTRGETKAMRVVVKADREGELVNCATVTAVPIVCVTTLVGKPVLTIKKSGPAVATLGADVTYTVVVANTGTTTAKNVVVTDPVPQGMGGSPVTINVGDLAPNQSKTLQVTFKATQRGRFCNVATAESSNAGKVSAEACTVVQQLGLKIEKTTTDKELLINRTASYSIVVRNTGDTKLTGVVVNDTAAAGTTVVSADGGSVNGNVATWNIGDLDAGASKTLNVKIMSRQPGNFCNTAVVTSAQGLKESSQACTEWIGVTGVLVEVVDDPDPIQVGESTTFTIRITNQGSTLDIRDLAVKTVFGAEMDPTSASSNGTVSGKNVTFPTVPTLAPKASVTYTIKAKGVKAGDHRMQTDVTTRLRTNPITELESTTVY